MTSPTRSQRDRPLVGTYRLQLRPGFGFAEVRELVPYLRDLGISHVYLSPPFEATEGSTHGYDVVDPNLLRSELGGESGFRALVQVAHEAGLGIVIDIVPHHMAATAANRWWWSVLERGRDSPFASHFDIDWDPPERRLRGSVLLPVLGDHYGRVLEAGELRLAHENGAIVASYYEHVAPLSPETADELWAIAGRRGSSIDEVLDEVNHDVDRLDAILDRQHHRFVRWQAAAHELDYRRFFDVDSLVALRSERVEVFDDTHRLALALVRDGLVDGLRIDHVDGLRDPESYLARLRSEASDTWITVEKILRPGETVPPTWPADGSTGYDFLADVTGVLVDQSGFDQLREAYMAFTGDDATYEEASVASRREALREALDADFERVVNLLLRVCEDNRRWRDFTRSELRDALAEVCVHAPAYRSYVRPGGGPTDSDRAFVDRAVTGASEARPDLDPGLLDFIRQLLLGELPGTAEVELVARFQQLTGPVAAKGEEDTAFYRWVPLLAANDVGTEPSQPSLDVDQFHARCVDRAAHWPETMLTTSTHDTKRSEDVRARLAVLSEVPDAWAIAVARWSEANERHRDQELDAPDRRDEWFIYETLVGAHPLPFDRAWPVVEKSLREAKRRTSWVRVNEEYETATRAFLAAVIADRSFHADLDEFVASISDTGQVNALTQTVLRMLTPGVPDLYQGCEVWDLSLVDPDNRREVDYDMRAGALKTIRELSAGELWEHRADGGIKLAVIRACFDVRRRHPGVFEPGGQYRPLALAGSGKDRVIGFTRGEDVAVAVPRLAAAGLPDEVTVSLPPGGWTNVLTGGRFADDARFGDLRGALPVALLERDLDPVG